MKKIVLAFSGGLDTSFCIPYLIDKGFEVHTIFVNSGGISSNEEKLQIEPIWTLVNILRMGPHGANPQLQLIGHPVGGLIGSIQMSLIFFPQLNVLNGFRTCWGILKL